MPLLEIDRRAFIASLGGAAAVAAMDHEARADALEHYAEHRLDELIADNQAGGAAAPRPRRPFPTVAELEAQVATRPTRRGVGSLFVAGGRAGGNVQILEKMPKNPTLVDFFNLRFMPANHVLQSATRAMKTGMKEEVILACLLHDVVLNLIKVDHGWWGAQLFEPYIPEKSSFAIRYHQTLRFYPDEEAGYEYPGFVPPDLRPRLRAAAAHPGCVQDAAQPQVVHGAAARHRERSLRVRSECRREPRPLHRHHRPPFQAAEGRARARQQPGRPHVADARESRSAALTIVAAPTLQRAAIVVALAVSVPQPMIRILAATLTFTTSVNGVHLTSSDRA